MLTEQGFSLLEMLFSIALSGLIIIATASFYPPIHDQTIHYYQKFRLEQTVQYALAGLSKDIKRSGFIANDPNNMKENPLAINSTNNCIIIRYDSEIYGDWRYLPYDPQNSDLFAYRYNKNNLEYKTGAVDCKGSNWEKMFDPNEIKITQFSVKKRANLVEIELNAELKNNPTIHYHLIKIIKNENAF